MTEYIEGWQRCLDKVSKDLENSVMPLTVPPKIHSDLAVVQNMEKGLPVLSAKGAGVSMLLSPHMENGVSGESVEGRVQGDLQWL